MCDIYWRSCNFADVFERVIATRKETEEKLN